MEHPRLNKFLATYLDLGRRQADELVATGKVTVNGVKARMGQRIAPSDTVAVNGKPVAVANAKPAFIYLALHKPVGYVCSRRQQGENPTIYSLLPKHYHHLKPVGRLDKDSSGLLLLTNDGHFTQRMTHPRFGKTKIYHVTLNAPLQPLHRQMINDHGITLPDGTSKLGLERLQEGDDTAWRVTMHEGRNRQIRRTFAALGYRVTKLHRIQLANFQLHDLPEGKFAEFTPHP